MPDIVRSRMVFAECNGHLRGCLVVSDEDFVQYAQSWSHSGLENSRSTAII